MAGDPFKCALSKIKDIVYDFFIVEFSICKLLSLSYFKGSGISDAEFFCYL